MARSTLAAAHELAHLGVTANVVDPGPVDTAWMTEEVRAHCVRATPLGRLGTPQDTAHLVDFLYSREGQWINGQLLMSNGGSAWSAGLSGECLPGGLVARWARRRVERGRAGTSWIELASILLRLNAPGARRKQGCHDDERPDQDRDHAG